MLRFGLDYPARIAVFASGRGSNLLSLFKNLPTNLGQVVLVISNKSDAQALQVAIDHQAKAVHIARDHFEERADQLLRVQAIDLICLAGFMRLLSPHFVAAWFGKILNIHPSLLPNFPGLRAQAQALAAGVSESGCTVHFVDEGVDTGAIILQRRVPILPGDTVESLSERILAEEHRAYPEAVRLVLEGKTVCPTRF